MAIARPSRSEYSDSEYKSAIALGQGALSDHVPGDLG